MNLLTFSLLFFLFPLSVCAKEAIDNAEQLIIVVTKNWDTHQGFLQCFEKNPTNGTWVLQGSTIPIVTGKNGLGWGNSPHFKPTTTDSKKQEGDGKGPAGIFSLGTAFGHTHPRHIQGIRLPYLEITPSLEAVDDPHSKYYNQIVDRNAINEIDWTSSEKMGLISLYLKGIVINHNTEKKDPLAGSQIFLHIWRTPTIGTAGCTAMSAKHIEELLHWLDPAKKPLFIQLPKEVYEQTANLWHLPVNNGQQ